MRWKSMGVLTSPAVMLRQVAGGVYRTRVKVLEPGFELGIG